jgi:hypothetical protein
MREAWHIFKKDARYLRFEIALVLAMLAIFTWIVRQGNPYGMDVAGIIPGAWIILLFSIASTYMMARLIHAETIPGDRQFWITRPYRWKSLFAAKVLFIIAFVNVPIFMARFVIIAAAGFPVMANLPGLLWSQAVMFLISQLPVITLAALTSGIMSFILTALVLMFVVSNAFFRGPSDAFSFPTQWIGSSILVVTMLAVAIPILLLQYRHRRTRFSRVLGIAGFVLLITLIRVISYTSELNAQTWISRQLSQTSSMGITVDAARLPPAHGLVPPDPQTKFVEIDIPLVANNVPEGQEVQFDAVDIWYETADGRQRHFDLAGLGRGSPVTSAEPVAQRELYMESTFFTAERDRPGVLHASVFATVFAGPQEKTIQLQYMPMNVLPGVQCYKSNFDLVRCRSALRWPRQLLEVKYEHWTGTIGPLPSYSPFPGEMNLNPIDDRTVGPASSGPITILIREPIAHVRRDIEVRNFRLADFVASGNRG